MEILLFVYYIVFMLKNLLDQQLAKIVIKRANSSFVEN